MPFRRALIFAAFYIHADYFFAMPRVAALARIMLVMIRLPPCRYADDISFEQRALPLRRWLLRLH